MKLNWNFLSEGGYKTKNLMDMDIFIELHIAKI